ncbi:MAG: hypothetical protein IJS67_03105 [Clostridia bacterium]|nr:hypothetical protein [Clostridia bacterium]
MKNEKAKIKTRRILMLVFGIFGIISGAVCGIATFFPAFEPFLIPAIIVAASSVIINGILILVFNKI